jgi:TM2 domain-containing membrane protein YozV
MTQNPDDSTSVPPSSEPTTPLDDATSVAPPAEPTAPLDDATSVAPPAEPTTPLDAEPTAAVPPPPPPSAATGVATYPNGKPMVDDQGRPASPKSRLAAALLAFFLGGLGIHRFYVGKIGTGILIIVTIGGFFGIWVLIDFIMILVGAFKDKQERYLANW